MLSQSQIRSRIAHTGAMCLLDSVQHWDASTIICQALAPTAAHPLAMGSVVPAVAAVEYAAQAAAVHGSLLDGAQSPGGMLAKLNDVELCGPGLDELGGPITIRAELLSRGRPGASLPKQCRRWQPRRALRRRDQATLTAPRRG